MVIAPVAACARSIRVIVFPSWLDPESRLKLHGYDGLPLDICVTAVKLPRDDRKDDDHFAEFVVRDVTR